MLLVYDSTTLYIVTRTKTMSGAMRSAKAANKRNQVTTYVVGTQESYDEANVWTTTYNMLDPTRKPIAIRKADLGGCCDPATERYHTM